MVAQNIFFGLIASVVVVSAIKVVTVRNVVHSALYLTLTLAGVGASFILLGAEFVGVTQVLVYIGAIVVLFLFGIMLTRATIGDEDDVDQPNRLPALLTAVLLLAVMSYAIIEGYRDTELPVETQTSAAEVGDSIFSQFIIPFEAVSVLLLAALIGAIVLARKE